MIRSVLPEVLGVLVGETVRNVSLIIHGEETGGGIFPQAASTTSPRLAPEGAASPTFPNQASKVADKR